MTGAYYGGPESDSPVAEAAKAAPSPSEVIRSWLPDHTHVAGPKLFDFAGETTWTWTTSSGVWTVALGGMRNRLTLIAPSGALAFGSDMDTALRRLRGVLVALDAIGVPTDV
jgi:hypothetical protein